MSRASSARAWDPLYGRMQLDELEWRLLKTPEVQRLRYIRMCNINSLLVTGASEISRYEHSLGVLFLARQWLAHAGAMHAKSGSSELRAAALLHDMQTGPFGHSLQYVLEDNHDFVHQDVAHGQLKQYHQQLTANAGFAGFPFSSRAVLGERWQAVTDLINGKGLFGPLINGTMDLDNIDNVVRLAFHAGLTEHQDVQVAIDLARAIAPHGRSIKLPERLMPAVSRWQQIRERLYTFLLLDWAEFSAKAMLTRAMEGAIQHAIIGTDSWIYTDDELISVLEKASRGEAQDIAEMVRRVRAGDLYTPVALLESTSVDLYSELSAPDRKRAIEREIQTACRGEKQSAGGLLFHVIQDWKKTRRAVAVVCAESEEEVVIGNDSQRLLIGIFSSKQLSDAQTLQIKGETMRVLQNAGAMSLQEIEDPMGDNDESRKCIQLSLI